MAPGETARPAQACRVCGQGLCLIHCVYCGIDASPALGLDHAGDCPVVTHVFPFDPGDWPHGARCCECSEPVEGHYTTIPVGPDGRRVPRGESDTVLVVCLGCAAGVDAGIQDVTP